MQRGVVRLWGGRRPSHQGHDLASGSSRPWRLGRRCDARRGDARGAAPHVWGAAFPWAAERASVYLCPPTARGAGICVECLQSLAPAREARDIALAAAILSANGFRAIEELVGACAADLNGQGRPLGPGLSSFLAELIRLAESSRRTAGALLPAPVACRGYHCCAGTREGARPAAAPRRSRSPARDEARPLSAASFNILDTVEGAIAAATAGEGDDIAPAALCPGKGPRAATASLKSQLRTPAARANWVERERVRSLLGSCPRSIASLRSGIRCWHGFCEGALGLGGAQIPPALDSLLAWASLFRCSGTFANYLSFVRTVCMLCRADTAVFKAPDLARARNAIRRLRGVQGGRAQVARSVGTRRKRRLFVPRKKMYIRHEMVARMLNLALRDAEQYTSALPRRAGLAIVYPFLENDYC